MTPKDREEMERIIQESLDIWGGERLRGQSEGHAKTAVEALLPFIEQLVVEARNEGIKEAVAAVKSVNYNPMLRDMVSRGQVGKYLQEAANAVSGLLPKEDQ